MCGILAIFQSSKEGARLRSLLLQQCKSLRHRGPDASGYVIAGVSGQSACERGENGTKVEVGEQAGEIQETAGRERRNRIILCSPLSPPLFLSLFSPVLSRSLFVFLNLWQPIRITCLKLLCERI